MCKMKNVTLSIPEELLAMSREYAARHQTTLNQLVRDMLKKVVQQKNPVDSLLEKSEQFAVNTKGSSFNRDEIYDREVLH
jgi:metal-responsive CopG/Arc/MetJ family transcriptional regulator